MSVNVLQQRTATQGYDIMGGGTPQPEEAEMDLVPTDGSSKPVTSNGIYDALLTKQDTLSFDSAPTADSTNPVSSGGVYTALELKQDTLTFDSTPTDGSTNPVTSGGVFDALASKQDGVTIYRETLTASNVLANVNTKIGQILVPAGKAICLFLNPGSGYDNLSSIGIYRADVANPTNYQIITQNVASTDGVSPQVNYVQGTSADGYLYVYGLFSQAVNEVSYTARYFLI